MRAHKRRAARGFAKAAFLHRRAAEDLAERLEAIPRRFDRALALGAPDLTAEALATRPDLSARIATLARADIIEGGDIVIDLESLDLGAARYDLIVSPLLLHWVNDLPGALANIRSALAPDGLFLGTMFGADTLQELRLALIEAESAESGGAAMRVAPFAQLYDLAGLLQRAGFALPAADRERVIVRYATPIALLADLRAMGETAPFVDRPQRALTSSVLNRAVETYRTHYSDRDGRVRATFDLLSMTGWAPHESQQKPLRPGSATARLADALNTTERSAGEKPG